MVGGADPFALLDAPELPVSAVYRQLDAREEATEIDSHDREMPWPENAPAVPAFPPSLAVRRHFRAPMGQLAAVYLCWVMDRISSEYSQPVTQQRWLAQWRVVGGGCVASGLGPQYDQIITGIDIT